MSHLGDRITPLVDGRLPADVELRARLHVAECPACFEAVELERRTKEQLTALAAPAPELDFLRQLVELAGPAGPLPPRREHVPGNPRPRQVAVSGAFSLVGASTGNGPLRTATVTARTRPAGPTGGVRPAGARATGGPGSPGTGRARLRVALVGALCVVGAGFAGGSVSGAEAGASAQGSSGPPLTSVVGGPAAGPTTGAVTGAADRLFRAQLVGFGPRAGTR